MRDNVLKELYPISKNRRRSKSRQGDRSRQEGPVGIISKELEARQPSSTLNRGDPSNSADEGLSPGSLSGEPKNKRIENEVILKKDQVR